MSPSKIVRDPIREVAQVRWLHRALTWLARLLAVCAAMAGVTLTGAAPALASGIAGGGALPNGTIGTPYSASITPSGGTGPYQIVVLPRGSAPPGLTVPMSGTDSVTISGTPTAAGSYTLDVTVTDSTNSTATGTYTLHVTALTPDAPAIGTATPGDGSASVAFTAPTVTGDGRSIERYTATASPGGNTGTCTKSPCKVGGLTDGVSYSLTVVATNRSGLSSAPSGASNAVTPLPGQTITFGKPTTQIYGTSPTLTATASSGLPVTFASSTGSVCKVSSTGQLTFVGVGNCTIIAKQAGNATYLPAPKVTHTFAVVQSTSGLTVTSSTPSNASVYGQPVTFTATFNPVPSSGKLQWSVAGTAVGSPRKVATKASYAFTPPTRLVPGAELVTATYLGNAKHASVVGSITQTVSKASTTTSVTVGSGRLTATVLPVAPGSGARTGTVSFLVDGVSAGSATVGAGGVATVTASTAGKHQVSAAYTGDADYLGSSGTRAVGPTVVAHVSSVVRKRAGWYRAPVSISFTCTPNNAPLASACPATKTLSRSMADQSVTVTVTGKDGAATTVSVTHINIDRRAPRLRVMRRGRRLSCDATDGLSGVASCVIRRHRSTLDAVRTVHWTAIARDRAGNRRIKRGSFSNRV
jgi:hypothetical protein